MLPCTVLATENYSANKANMDPNILELMVKQPQYEVATSHRK